MEHTPRAVSGANLIATKDTAHHIFCTLFWLFIFRIFKIALIWFSTFPFPGFQWENKLLNTESLYAFWSMLVPGFQRKKNYLKVNKEFV